MVQRQDDEAVLSARESLALIDGQRAKVARALDVDPVLLYGTWGVAWSVGFALYALSWGSQPVLGTPQWLAGAVFALLMAAAVVVTAVHTSRARRGVAGASAMVGAIYGWSWFLGFAGLAAVISAVARLTSDGVVLGLLWTAGSGLLVGVLYMMAAALWRDPYQFGLGAWIVVTSAGGALAGLPALYWVMCLAGGGGFLVSAAVFAARTGQREGRCR